MTRIGVAALALLTLVFSVVCDSAVVYTEASFGWQTDGNGGIIITGYTGPGGAVVIPEQIDGSPVIAIGEWAFVDKRLTSVVIPDSVTYIGNSAFHRNQLSSVIIPDRVTGIGSYAFYVNQLTSVTIPDSVTDIGDGAFRNNILSSAIIGSSVTDIGQYAFSSNRLTSVIIPDNVTTIWNWAFSDNFLTSIVIGENVAFEYVVFGYGFEAAYENNGRMTGAYTRPDTDSTAWTRNKI